MIYPLVAEAASLALHMCLPPTSDSLDNLKKIRQELLLNRRVIEDAKMARYLNRSIGNAAKGKDDGESKLAARWPFNTAFPHHTRTIYFPQLEREPVAATLSVGSIPFGDTLIDPLQKDPKPFRFMHHLAIDGGGDGTKLYAVPQYTDPAHRPEFWVRGPNSFSNISRGGFPYMVKSAKLVKSEIKAPGFVELVLRSNINYYHIDAASGERKAGKHPSLMGKEDSLTSAYGERKSVSYRDPDQESAFQVSIGKGRASAPSRKDSVTPPIEMDSNEEGGRFVAAVATDSAVFALKSSIPKNTDDRDASDSQRPSKSGPIRKTKETYKLESGKHRGKTLRMTYVTDGSYIDWLIRERVWMRQGKVSKPDLLLALLEGGWMSEGGEFGSALCGREGC